MSVLLARKYAPPYYAVAVYHNAAAVPPVAAPDAGEPAALAAALVQFGAVPPSGTVWQRQWRPHFPRVGG